MLAGIVCGVVACMLWGLVYLVPLVVPGYEPLLIAAGRFVGFGVVAVPLLWMERREFARYTLKDWWTVTQLGVVGNIVYYWCLINCIQNAGAPFAGMCMSLIPVLVALISNWRSRATGASIAWRRLAPGLALIGAGLVAANAEEFSLVLQASRGDAGPFLYGVLMGVCALLIWTWYPIRNAEWLLANPHRSPRSWSTAQGMTTFPFACLLYLCVWGASPDGTPFLGPTPVWFVVIVGGSGILCSWLGIVFWNAMSQRLPTALGGQMIVFETIFAVIYAHMLRGAWPSPAMVVGMVLLIAGVLVSLRAFDRTRTRQNAKA